jgi:serine/threonine protein kinase
MGQIKAKTVIQSPVTGSKFRVAEVLGQGGFGCAYRAHLLGPRGKLMEELCLKVTPDSESWHREAYFGELLRPCDRAIHMHESFPLFPRRKGGEVQYCLIFELAEGGTIYHHLAEKGKPWTEKRATEEIVGLLKLLDQLHGSGALHRDITPMNIFVCRNRRLKLGDFGIARHVLAGEQAPASVFNPWFVSANMAQGAQRFWLACDDVYQMGQVFAMLLRGSSEDLITVEQVQELECGERTKEVIGKAIGPRKERYRDACGMLKALLGEEDCTGVEVDSLDGKKVVFTGTLSIPRFDAEVLLRQAGGTVVNDVSKNVDVVVVGARSPNYLDGHKGEKLIKAEKLIKQGHEIGIIDERQFMELVDD